ncbi:hypothetical protein M9H77_08755 [Catharanthus roseus]|uniref:Uncharacterized protein n=1 Tax=Catharanthus roseus TaxID=4058 RepID=A0ACC0BYU1_CATRO|nr:hypothetical protein M9H77_08755 [Catharanthus roseus]
MKTCVIWLLRLRIKERGLVSLRLIFLLQEVWWLNLKHLPSWPKKEDTPKMVFQDHSKPKVEEKGRLITNPIRCFKCNGMGHIVINCPTKTTLVFSEDLNRWIEKSEDDCQEGIVDKEESSEDRERLPLLKPMKRV